MFLRRYLENGNGRGLRAVLIFNLLVAGLIWWASGNMMKNFFNAMPVQTFINSIPEITIEDHQVVSPVNMNETRSLGNLPLLYIQTDRDLIGVGAIQDGIYVTRKAVTVFSNGAIVSQNAWPDDLTVNPQTINGILHQLSMWMPVLFALIYMAGLWVLYLVAVGFIGLISLIGHTAKRLTKGEIWRTTMLAYIFVFVVDFVLGFLGKGIPTLIYNGHPLPLLTQFVAVVVLTLGTLAVLLFCHPKKTTTFVNIKKTEVQKEKKNNKKKFTFGIHWPFLSHHHHKKVSHSISPAIFNLLGTQRYTFVLNNSKDGKKVVTKKAIKKKKKA